MSNATFRYYLEYPNLAPRALYRVSLIHSLRTTPANFQSPSILKLLRGNYSRRYTTTESQQPQTVHYGKLEHQQLANKFEEIKEWLGQEAFDILSIQETKIDRTFPNSQFHVEGFKLFRRDRVKGGGGIAVFISDNIIATN